MGSKKEEMLSAEAQVSNPPPPYELADRGMYESTDSDSSSEDVSKVPTSGGLTLPGVIPREYSHEASRFQY